MRKAKSVRILRSDVRSGPFQFATVERNYIQREGKTCEGAIDGPSSDAVLMAFVLYCHSSLASLLSSNAQLDG
jgi:hypothetical protein